MRYVMVTQYNTEQTQERHAIFTPLIYTNYGRVHPNHCQRMKTHQYLYENDKGFTVV